MLRITTIRGGLAAFILTTAVGLVGLPTPARGADLSFRPMGPLGGDVRSLVQDPSDPRRLYAGTVDGILYRSLNAGASWTRLDPGFPRRGASLDDLLVTETGDIYASFWNLDDSGGGIARSMDHGVTFQMIGAGLEGEAVRGLARAPSDPTSFVAVTKNGVFRSLDSADSFSRISRRDHPDLKMIGSVAIDPRNENSILVGTAHLAWRTDNGGRTWRPIQQGMIDDSDVMTLTLDRREPTTVFATACTGIWRSRNSGASWNKVLGIPSVSRRTRAFAQDHNRPDTFYAGTTDGVYVSDDDARSFVRTTPAGLIVNALISLGGGRVLAGVEGEGVLASTDFGRTWTPSNDGFRERLVRQIIPDETRRRLLVITGADGAKNSALFEMDRIREMWSRVHTPEGREVRMVGVLDGGDLILGTDDGVFRGSALRGEWTRLPLTVNGADAHPHVLDIRIRGSLVLVASDQGLFSSPDRGATFVRVPLGQSRAVETVAIAPGGRVVAATPLAVYESDDGTTFRPLAPIGLRGLKRLAFAPGSDEKIFASTSLGLLFSDDGGRSWFQANTPFARVTGLTQHPNGKTVFAADADVKTVFLSEDGAATFWPLKATGLPSQRTFALAIEEPHEEGDPHRLFVAASGGGLFEALLAADKALSAEKR